MARRRDRAGTPPAAPVQPAASPVRRVRFVVAHTHRGIDYRAGDAYDATPEEVELLAFFGVIEALP